MFIVFEGIDGSGKTTQAKLLYEHMKKNGKVLLTDEPTRSYIGVFVHGILRSKIKIDPLALQLLFTADRAEHVSSFIKPKLEKGYTIISDRYYLSTIVYGSSSGIDAEWLKKANESFVKPDLTFVIDIDPKSAIDRLRNREHDTEYFDEIKFLSVARKKFLELSKADKSCFIIDGSRSKEEISEEIIKIVERNNKKAVNGRVSKQYIERNKNKK
ncbi:MAG: dTMP kinase [Candidatus Micrarchaeia archaeon]